MEIVYAPTWDHFKGEPDYTSGHSAYLYWYITYSFDYIIIDERISVKVEAAHEIQDKSWVKPQSRANKHLLRHEQFHYFIGVLCCAEFKRRTTYTYNWTFDNLCNEVDEVFNNVFKEYIVFEQEYDEETRHGVNMVKQLEWETVILERLEYLGVFVIF
jgi:hypothetical protein